MQRPERGIGLVSGGGSWSALSRYKLKFANLLKITNDASCSIGRV